MATLAVRLALAALNKALVKSLPNSTQKVSRKRGRVKAPETVPILVCHFKGSFHPTNCSKRSQLETRMDVYT
jgi:hypothetical protein